MHSLSKLKKLENQGRQFILNLISLINPNFGTTLVVSPNCAHVFVYVGGCESESQLVGGWLHWVGCFGLCV